MTKQQLRKIISEKRKALSAEFKQRSSKAIIRSVEKTAVFSASETIALYMSFGGEVQLDALFPVCWDAGKRTCIPVYNENSKQYDMAEITSDTKFTQGHYGIREPVSPHIISIEEIDLMAIPGVAFDVAGNRLGRGGGFYDRMLSGFKGVKAAVAFDFQIFNEVPTEPHDLPVDLLISEIKTLKF